MLASINESWHAAWDVWEHLTHALGAQLCASFELLSADPTHTVQWTMAPLMHSTLLGQLPQEALCVENLGHWLHAVPSKKQEGLKKLLRGARQQWFNAPYLSLQLSLTRESASSSWLFRQTMTGVVRLADTSSDSESVQH